MCLNVVHIYTHTYIHIYFLIIRNVQSDHKVLDNITQHMLCHVNAMLCHVNAMLCYVDVFHQHIRTYIHIFKDT